MNTLTCICVLMCAGLAASVPFPGIQPAESQEAPVQPVAVEETLEPQESAWGGGYGRHGGFGGFRGGYGGFGGGFGGFRGGYGHFGGFGGGYGVGFGGFRGGYGGFGYGR